MEGASTITIVHLSDTRFDGTTDDRGGQSLSTPEDRLLEDLSRLRKQQDIRPDLVVISGDLTERALPAEFTRAREFATALTAGLRFDSDRVMIVPGDHDVSWALCKAYLFECEGEGLSPETPYRHKWKPYTDMLKAFYADVSGGRAFRDPVDGRVRPAFPIDEPWTLLQIPRLRVVVAGLNSTMPETHEVHHGSLGEQQIRWFFQRLRWYAEQGWLRIGVVHHSPEHPGAARDPAPDLELFKQYLAGGLNLILHGHTSEAELCRLGPEGVPVLSAGSTREESTATVGQYQIVQVHRGGLRVMTRRYQHSKRRWVGDNGNSDHGDLWYRDLEVRLRDTGAAIFPAAPAHTSPAASVRSIPAGLQGPPTGEVGVEGPSPRDDLLARVEEICRLRAGGAAVITRVTLESSRPATSRLGEQTPPLRYLRVVHSLDGSIRTYPVGVCERSVTADDLELFIARVHRPYRDCDPGVVSVLVYRGDPVAESVRQAAIRRGVRLESFVNYQGVYDLSRYVARQTLNLETDQTHYPERLYVPHRYTLIGEPGTGGQARVHSDLVGQVVEWLAEPARRFILVLGDSGTGKSFLLRQLARRMRHELPHVAPLLMDLRTLEYSGGLDELVVSHLAASGEEHIDLPKLRYLRRQGRVALLFDGFDELEQRVSYDRAAEHLERLLCMVEGQAKVVLTCRTQHFLNDEQATRPIADRLEVGVRRIARLAEFNDAQIRQFQDQLAAPISKAARAQIAARLEQIRGVPRLAGLARNPRMLGFITRLPEDRLRTVDSPAALYRELIIRWLGYEYERAHPPGRKRSLTPTQRWDAVIRLALRLCLSSERTLRESDLREAAGALQNLATVRVAPETATQMIGSETLLNRTFDGRFGFVHQSVAEWLVAWQASHDLNAAARRDRRGTTPSVTLGAGRTSSGTLPGEGDRVLRLTRLSDLTIEFLCGLTAPEALWYWIKAVTADPTSGDPARSNALAIRGRLKPSESRKESHCEAPKTTTRPGPRAPAAAPGRMAIRLIGQNLRGHRFAGDDLSREDLSRADLTEADLTGARLEGALLNEANLTRARLDGARLVAADLTGADLTACRLLGADLTGARLDKVHWDRTALIGANLDPPALRQLLPKLMRTGSAPPDGAGVKVRAELLAGAGVAALAVAPSGEFLIAGGTDDMIRIWDTRTGQLVRALAAGCGEVRAVVAGGWASGRGVWLAAGGSGRPLVGISELAAGGVTRSLAGHTSWVQAIAAARNGRWLATGSADGAVKIWDITSGKELHTLTGHSGGVWATAIDPDGTWLASGGADGTVRIWEARTGQELHTLTGHSGGVWAIAIDPDGTWLASGGADGTVRIRDTATWRERFALVGHGDSVYTLASGRHRAGSWLAAGSDDHTVRIWNPATGRPLRVLRAHRRAVSALVAGPDGSWFASGGADGTVRIWDVLTGRERATLVSLTAGGWAVLLPDLRYKLEGTPNGEFRYLAGLCRFEPGELDPYLPQVQRLAPDVPLAPWSR